MKKIIEKIDLKAIIIAFAISMAYFIFPDKMKSPISLIAIVAGWLYVFYSGLKKWGLANQLINMMILSVPLSFISIFGQTESLVFLNWFHIFTILFLVYAFFDIIKNWKTTRFSILDGSIVLAIIGLAVSFALNWVRVKPLSITQMLLILFFLVSVLMCDLLMNSGRHKETFKTDFLLRQLQFVLMGMALCVLIQFVAYKNGVVIGRVENYANFRLALGFINFDFSFLSLLLLVNIFYPIQTIIQNKRLDIISVISIGLALLSSTLTSARTGLMTFVIVLSMMTVLYVFVFNKLSLSIMKRILVFVLLAAVSGAILYFMYKKRGFGSSGRTEINRDALAAFRNRPIGGNGLNWISRHGVMPHNFFTQYLAQTGVVFIVPITVALTLVINKIRQSNIVIFANSLICIVGSMFIPDILNSRFFLLIVILGLVAQTVKPKEQL
ncbi:hypothetical protein G7062_06945 [Erysipelothrix sp. HDW6C]|uniref:O-antigen ligase family protein n=1 Tax=Erysipelothrix sp. HDW6C TaxID=2714930 RepID=UPI00140B6C2C|nr:O-antigen ligase family protein [Erysipelothrix sp. HDW6C]QIK70035.1 hypothetical protein G7062_06945 [Erysipelothrix sp. HDW6C]